MKKQYEVPKAEKLVFNYAESVEACWWSLMKTWGQQGSDSTTTKSETGNKVVTFNNDPNGQYYKCLATYYHNC